MQKQALPLLRMCLCKTQGPSPLAASQYHNPNGMLSSVLLQQRRL
jgi:hypothetical protein